MRGLLLVFLPALLLAQVQTPPPTSAKTGQADKIRTSSQDSGVNSERSNRAPEPYISDSPDSSSGHTGGRAGDEPTGTNNGTNLRDWIIAAFTIILAGLAGAQFWAMQQQAEYMRLHAEQMRKQAEHMHEALVETRTAANAAHSASATAKVAVETSKKATVDIEAILGAQNRAMQQQAEHMRGQAEQIRKQTEHMREALAETKVAANAAYTASATARMALEVSNRANVDIESILLRDPRPVGNRRIENLAARSCIEITIKNHGATPAQEMHFEFRAAMPPYIEEPVAIVGKETELHTLVSARSEFRPIHEMCTEFFKDTDVNLFLEDLRVDGHIRYKDIFGHGHRVECSAVFNPAVWQFDIVRTVRSEA